MERIKLNIRAEEHYYQVIKYIPTKRNDNPKKVNEEYYEQIHEFGTYGQRDRWYILLNSGYSRTYYAELQ